MDKYHKKRSYHTENAKKSKKSQKKRGKYEKISPCPSNPPFFVPPFFVFGPDYLFAMLSMLLK